MLIGSYVVQVNYVRNDGDIDCDLQVFFYGFAVQCLERARCCVVQVVPMVDAQRAPQSWCVGWGDFYLRPA